MDDHTMQAAALKEFRELCYVMIDCSKPIVSLLCVSPCVPDEDFETTLLRVAGRLARGAQRPVRRSKHALNDLLCPAEPFAQ